MNSPKVSIIITTKNESKNIKNCLDSLTKQTYNNIEIIVVDNNSSDNTKQISREYTSFVFDKGPERSAQRNLGAQKAKGKYVLFLDADMVLTSHVVEECVKKMGKEKVGGLIIPEVSFGTTFWAKAKALERSFYVGNDAIEAARFYDKDVFKKVGGFDESITGPEDWDFSQRVKTKYGLRRITSFIRHNEGNLSLIKTMQKKYYYAKKFSIYLQKSTNKSASGQQVGVVQRYWLFLSHPVQLFRKPVVGVGMLFMKTCEFAAGSCGYVVSMVK